MTVAYPCTPDPRLRFSVRWPLALALGLCLFAGSLMADEAQWIWSPRHTKEDVPQTSCYFRKSFMVQEPESGEIALTADDSYRCFMRTEMDYLVIDGYLLDKKKQPEWKEAPDAWKDEFVLD